MENKLFLIKICKTSCLSLIVLFFTVLLTDSALAAENRKSVYITGIQNEQTHVLAKKVIQEAYRRIGYKVRFNFLPGKRSINMANNGESDGDIARIDGTHKKFTNLVPVPTPLIYFSGVTFTKTITKKIKGWEDLKGLQIGVIRGVRYSEIGTRGLSPLFANDMTHLFKLLDQKMIQVAIATSRAGQIEIFKNFKRSGIHVIGKQLYSGPLYHFVHKKNQNIVPQLNSVLQEMKKHNEIKTIVETSFNLLLKN